MSTTSHTQSLQQAFLLRCSGLLKEALSSDESSSTLKDGTLLAHATRDGYVVNIGLRLSPTSLKSGESMSFKDGVLRVG